MNLSLEQLVLSTESLVAYPQYYIAHGVRRPLQLLMPPAKSTATLRLPKSSILHYIPDDISEYGIPQDELILHHVRKAIQVEHVLEQKGNLGNPRVIRMVPTTMIRNYHKKYRKTRWCRNRQVALNDPNTLLVESYGLIPHLYRYPPHVLRGYYRWRNLQETLWSQVHALGQVTDRNQFFVVKLPKVIPTRALLTRFENAAATRELLRRFNTPSLLFFLEMWRWIREPKNSVLGAIGPHLDKMHFVFIHNGRWFTINLGVWRNWIYDAKNPPAKIPPGAATIEQTQLRFLKMVFNFVKGLEAPATEEELKAERDAAKSLDEKSQPTPQPQTEEERLDNRTNDDVVFNPIEIEIPDVPELQAPVITKDAEAVTEKETAEVDAALKKEFDQIDELESEWEKENVSETEEAELDETGNVDETFEPTMVNYTSGRPDPQKAFMEKADALADSGRLSAAEYRRLQALSTVIEKLENPFNPKEKLSEGIEITQESLKVESDVKLPPITGLVDTSMGQSTVQAMDRNYIKNVLHKDILRSVVGVQTGGIAVTDYQVQEVEDATGHYEDHTVQLTPMQGKPSTVKFRLPKVQPDGTFFVKGTRYRSRKMRIDMPVRKVAPNRVALTSAYGKVFIQRSEKKAYDYPNWLNNQIAAKAIDPNNTEVQNAAFADVFDPSWRVPRTYSTLAQRFRTVTIGEIEFYFDYDNRKAHFGETEVNQIEKDDTVVIGRKGKTLIGIDRNNQLVTSQGEYLGTIESLMELGGKSPIETADVKILGKQVPVGIVLSYLLGFENLLRLLNVKSRRVPADERLHLNDDEFAIRFLDESLIFRREDQLSSMILSGFLVIDDAIRQYPMHQFNRKDIYLTALYKERLSIRYLREMDLLNDLFVDPTTAEILESMKEPTRFTELLIRSTELLTTDWSPDETDMEYQRIVGYEKFANHVYRELVTSIRLYRARGASVGAKIEIPPYQIYQAVTQDPAVKLVEECNPIHNLKESEEVTFTGTGGRSTRSMTGKTRLFMKNDLGTISEATKDSSDVAVTTFLTADPKFTSLRGTTERFDGKSDGATRALSSTAMLMPGSDHDDKFVSP